MMGLWAGTYERLGGAGLVPLDAREQADAVGAIRNASFAVRCPRTDVTYFVNEQDEGEVHAWRQDGGTWTSLGHVPSGGKAPCFLGLSPDETRLAVANYGDGRVGLIELDPERGHLLGLSHVMREQGRGPDPERQQGPHAHCALFSPDGARLFHVDLGLDRVFAWNGSGGGTAECVFEAPPGSGPRHLAFHPDGHRALLLSELSATLFLLEWNGEKFEMRDSRSILPEPFSGQNLGGHLAVLEDGSVLVTNRGHDSIVSFAIAHGRLKPVWWEKTGGSSPRHFVVHGRVLVIAHEEDSVVSTVPIPGLAGKADATRRIVPGAVFVLETPETATTPAGR